MIAVFGAPCPKKIGSVGWQQSFISFYFFILLKTDFLFWQGDAGVMRSYAMLCVKYALDCDAVH